MHIAKMLVTDPYSVAANEIESASVIEAKLNCDNAHHRPRLSNKTHR